MLSTNSANKTSYCELLERVVPCVALLKNSLAIGKIRFLNVNRSKHNMEKLLNAEEIQNLFTKFAFPLVDPAITDHQKKVSPGIAKVLWVTLVGRNNTEKQIYPILDEIFKDNRESTLGIGSLYFFKERN